jgi:subfamily B ATP-binding cassette protein MsbA
MKILDTINKRFSDFFFFYHYLGLRMVLNVFFSIITSLMDGLGLALFIPLLQIVDSGEAYNSGTGDIGNLDVFVKALESLGLSLNLITVLLLILFFFFAKGAFKFTGSYYDVILANYFIKKIQFESVEKITNLNYKHFLKLDSGKIQNSLTQEISRVYLAYQQYSMSIQSMITVLVYLGLAFLTNPQFAVLVVIGGALSNLIYTRLYKKTKETSKKITMGFHDYHGLVLQKIHNFKYLRSTGRVFGYNEKIKDVILRLAEANKRIGFFNSVLYSTREPLSIAVVVAVIFVQIYFFGSTLGPIILSLLFFYRSLNQIIVFQNYWNQFLNYSGSLVGYKDFITELANHQIQYNAGHALDSIDDIELKSVDFNYGDFKLLLNVNLKVKKNQTIAFVGPSGSGKTTLTNIITGLVEVDKGEVLINGIDMRDLNLFQYQSRIGYITQEPVIFNDSLFNNVTFWKPKSKENMDRFFDCIQKASLSDFYSGLSEKEDTSLGSNGIMVSGGQRQRIAIARELFNAVDLFVLDEATSALDSSTEREIQNYFEELKGRFTMIIIAHRLSTIKNADVIYLLKDGMIKDSGDFGSLYSKSADFKRMVELQEFSTLEN